MAKAAPFLAPAGRDRVGQHLPQRERPTAVLSTPFAAFPRRRCVVFLPFVRWQTLLRSQLFTRLDGTAVFIGGCAARCMMRGLDALDLKPTLGPFAACLATATP